MVSTTRRVHKDSHFLSKWITKRNKQAGSYRKDKSKLKPPNHHKKSIVPLVKETKLILSSAVPVWTKEMYSKKTNWADFKIPKIPKIE